MAPPNSSQISSSSPKALAGRLAHNRRLLPLAPNPSLSSHLKMGATSGPVPRLLLPKSGMGPVVESALRSAARSSATGAVGVGVGVMLFTTAARLYHSSRLVEQSAGGGGLERPDSNLLNPKLAMLSQPMEAAGHRGQEGYEHSGKKGYEGYEGYEHVWEIKGRTDLCNVKAVVLTSDERRTRTAEAPPEARLPFDFEFGGSWSSALQAQHIAPMTYTPIPSPRVARSSPHVGLPGTPAFSFHGPTPAYTLPVRGIVAISSGVVHLGSLVYESIASSGSAMAQGYEEATSRPSALVAFYGASLAAGLTWVGYEMWRVNNDLFYGGPGVAFLLSNAVANFLLAPTVEAQRRRAKINEWWTSLSWNLLMG